MDKKTGNIKIITGLFLFAATTFLLASLHIKEVQSDYVLQTEVKIAEQETILASLAELTDRDGADAVVAAIIKDCELENRGRFDTLLGKLSQLQYVELVEIKQLFNDCGSYFAERKAIMVARLEREYEVYADYVEILALVDDRKEIVSPKVKSWGELVEFEKQRSEHSGNLVALQGLIIDALLDGISISSDEMQKMLKEAQTAKDSFIYLNTQIDTLRPQIIEL